MVRICRLGKNIAPRFANRYYDAVTVGSGHPVTVWGFLVIHHAERFVLVPSFKEFNCFVGNNIRSISFFYDMFSVFPEIRIVIVTLLMLAAKDTPMVETLRFADEVPFAEINLLI